MLTQLPRVPSLIPSSLATRAIGREVSITIFTASSRNSGEKLFFGRGNYFTFPDIHPNGWTVRKPRGTPLRGSVLTGWEDLPSCEAEAGMLAGDPVFLSPDHRVDALLGAYGRSRAFRRFTTARPGCGRWIS